MPRLIDADNHTLYRVKTTTVYGDGQVFTQHFGPFQRRGAAMTRLSTERLAHETRSQWSSAHQARFTAEIQVGEITWLPEAPPGS